MSAFVIKVKTDNSGTSASDQFTLPGNPGFSYNFDIDWGDGSSVETINTGSSWTHTFAGGAGTYSVSITENVAGGFAAIYFNNGGDKLKLLEIEQWGTNQWDDFTNAYYGCTNLTITAVDEATANTGGVSSFINTWRGCSSLTSFPSLDTSSGTNFSSAWRDCSSLTSFPLLDTSSGTNFSFAWRGCSSLTSFPLLNTSSGTSFSNAWYGCNSLTSFPLLDTSSGTDFTTAWRDCSSLASFPLLDTSSGTNFIAAWRGCTSLTSFPLLNTSSGTNFSYAWYGCTSLTSFPVLDTSSGTNFSFAWYGCSSLTSFPLLDASSGTNFSSAWRDCSSLASFPVLDLSSMSNGALAFFGVTLQTASYNAILASSFTNNVNNSVTFHGGNSKYHDTGQAVRDVLTAAPRNWTITDGGYDATYVPPATDDYSAVHHWTNQVFGLGV